MRLKFLLFLIFVFLFGVSFISASYKLFVSVDKLQFAPGESMLVKGKLFNHSNTGSGIVFNATVNVSIFNLSNSSVHSSFNLTTDNEGLFRSRGSSNSSSYVLIYAPSISGNYSVVANYSDSFGNYSTANISFLVSSNASLVIDGVQALISRFDFEASENVRVDLQAFYYNYNRTAIPVEGVQLNGTLRQANGSIVTSSLNCTTASNGRCFVTFTAPSTPGVYFLEFNDHLAFVSFRVNLGFRVFTWLKDQSGVSERFVFGGSEVGSIYVRVSANSSNATFNATPVLFYANGTQVSSSLFNLTDSLIVLNSNNNYYNSTTFSTENIESGYYYFNVTARSSNSSESLNSILWLSIVSWRLTVKKASVNSGFEYGYSAFPNSTLRFEASADIVSNSSSINNLNSINASIRDKYGASAGNVSAVVFNASCGQSGCYEFNLTSPSVVGTYSLVVNASYGGLMQFTELPFSVIIVSATAQTVDEERVSKTAFGVKEFVYFSFQVETNNSQLNASDAQLVSLINSNGDVLNYSNSTWQSMNASDSNLTWAFNYSSRLLRLDSPQSGGSYTGEFLVNNRSVRAVASFAVNPFQICSSAKSSSDTSISDYYWQFKTTSTVYLFLTVVHARNVAGNNSASSSGGAIMHGTYGASATCSVASNEQAVVNASINMTNVLNVDLSASEALNSTVSTCSGITLQSGTSGYLCTLQPSDGIWSAGKYSVALNVSSSDGALSDFGYAFFEVRDFYIYGYSSNWMNRPSSNVTLNINMYEAGSGWWTGSSGLLGTASVQKVEFIGSWADPVWPPLTVDYNLTNSSTVNITTGSGSLILNPSFVSSGLWRPGAYTVTIRGTTSDGRVDYGKVWFEVRQWDAYASPIFVSSGSFTSKYTSAPNDTVSLFVRIYNAGDYSDSGGTSLGGNVTISVKKLQFYTSWPPQEVTRSWYNSTSIIVANSSPWYYGSNAVTYAGYVLNLTPNSRWDSGYYNVVLDINGTETGYGWFDVKAFYASATPVNDSTRGYQYSFTGSTPVYFNVTSSTSESGVYSSSYNLNTTVVGAKLYSYSSGSYTSSEFNAPQDFTIVNSSVNGSGLVALSKIAGAWQSGWYWGQLTLQDGQGNRVTTWIGFSIEPFRIYSILNSYLYTSRQNVTGTLNIQDAFGNSLNGNYSITSIQDQRWTEAGRSTQIITSYAPNSTQVFLNSTNLTIEPLNGAWSAGYHNLVLTVNNTNTNASQTSWLWFEAQLFNVTETIANPNVYIRGNATVNITVTPAGGEEQLANLTRVYYYYWDGGSYVSRIREVNFSTSSCSSATSTGGCTVNRSSNVTLIPANGQWDQGYQYLYFAYSNSSDSSQTMQRYSYIYVYARDYISDSFYTVDSNNYYRYAFNSSETVRLVLYDLRYVNGTYVNQVTVVNVSYASSNSCWYDGCRTYVAIPSTNWSASGLQANMLIINGYVSITPPQSGWPSGTVAIKLTVSKDGINSTLSGSTFYVN